MQIDEVISIVEAGGFELDFKLFGCGILNFRGNIAPYFRALILYAFLKTVGFVSRYVYRRFE